MEKYLSIANCKCGKNHDILTPDVVMGKGAIERLPEIIHQLSGKKVFLLADVNTFAVAGESVCKILDGHGIAYVKYVYPDEHLEPDEKAVGSAVMHFDAQCDLVVGIGSGVINDIGKLLCKIAGRKYIIVATAPSMDGYASCTSSTAVDGLKVSLPSHCADVIVGDTDILKNAPIHMLKAGLGDMLAKYVSIAEWQIAHLITGEYYCEAVAELVRVALNNCVDNAEGLLKRDEKAVEAVFEGLVISGLAMSYAGVSRPASGVEHYFSHVWDMRGLEFGTQVDLHGIQCALGTLLTAKLYDALKKMTPDENIARAYVDSFCYEQWADVLRNFLGHSGETMIALEKKEQKYDKSTHPARFARIAKNWDEILDILNEELPGSEEIARILHTIGVSTDAQDLGLDKETLKLTFMATKDIRNKYVLSHLAWDMGVLDELCNQL